MVKIITIEESFAGQRIDNFLFTLLKGVPKSRIYRGLRKGEFRVNGRRVTADYRLNAQDHLRVPPLRVSPEKPSRQPPTHLMQRLESRVLYEDERMLVLNKPSGIPVHGGSQISWGVIELVRQMRPQAKSLELIHRLDRDTSGCLLIAKRRSTLLEWHRLIAERQVAKEYTLAVAGRWDPKQTIVRLPLKKNVLQSGERMVTVDPEGKPCETRFRIIEAFETVTLLSATLITGRTHQLRVHTAALGHPIVGDEKYGNRQLNRQLSQQGIKRLLLHCSKMARRHQTDSGFQEVTAPLDQDFSKIKRFLASQ